MACTIAVARRGQQRSLVRIRQLLRVAMARSPSPRSRARKRLTAFSLRDRAWPSAVAFERSHEAAASTLIVLIREG